MQLTDRPTKQKQNMTFLAEILADACACLDNKIKNITDQKIKTCSEKMCKKNAESNAHQVSESKWSNTCVTRSKQSRDFQ